MQLQTFFNPQSVAIVGVSESAKKLGSVIFQNVLDSQYDGELIAVNPKLAGQKIGGKIAVGSISELDKAVDLVVVVVPSRFVEPVIADCVKNKTKNVVIISAGFGEVGEKDLEKKIMQTCADNDINLLGPNCLGVIFPYANLNASFSDGYPRTGNIAFISQSGAFCTAVLDWAEEKNIGFSHFVSLGNKAGISELDLLENLADDPKVKMFALYLESIKDGEEFLRKIKKISKTKPVIILEPGESVAAKKASSSHTGSLAPNSVVVQEAYRESGAIQVFSMREMFGILEMLTFAPNENYGKRTAIVTNAGGVGVLSSDLVDESPLYLADISDAGRKKLAENLPAEAGLVNPIDIVGDAAADRYETTLEIICAEKNIDQVLVLLTPQRTTEVEKTAEIIAKYAKQSDKNIVAAFVGGQKVLPGIEYLRKHQVPAFSFPADAVKVMGLIANAKAVHVDNFTVKACTNKERCQEISGLIAEAQTQKLKSLPATLVRKILIKYEFDVPPAEVFTDQKFAEKFVQDLLPKPVVMKLASPDAMHKTELKGVFLNIDSVEKFNEAWKNLTHSIEIAKLRMAAIQIQEQVPGGQEIILGVNTDPNFGKVMIFGSGGIYTEVFHDTALRVLPARDFGQMIKETKMGKVLHGVRGEEPKAVAPMINTMKKVQQMVTDFPEITSIDANPVFVTEERAVCVDFKIYL